MCGFGLSEYHFFFKSQEIKNQIGKCARGLFDLIKGEIIDLSHLQTLNTSLMLIFSIKYFDIVVKIFFLLPQILHSTKTISKINIG